MKILVPVDGSQGASAAARFAAELAGLCKGTLHLLHVYDSPTATSLGLRSLSREELEKVLESKATLSFAGAREAIGDDFPELTITQQGELGDPAPTILRYAHSGDYDLIVIGRRGLTPMKELLLGSVSSRVLHNAGIPVTVVSA